MQNIRGVLDAGFVATPIEVECHVTNGLPTIIIVGFANKAVDEAKERLRAAFQSSALPLPKKRITLNLAPADMPKDSTSLDVAMALAVLSTSKAINTAWFSNTVCIGELGLDSTIRPVRGIIGKILGAKELGYTRFIIPSGNIQQASLIPDIELYPFDSLAALYTSLQTAHPEPWNQRTEVPISHPKAHVAFEEIVGQDRAKRALLIAASGGHNILLYGPPGTGKSMLVKAFAGILPPLSRQESLEVSHIHSLTQQAFDTLVTERPFRSPRHTSSITALAGGGHRLRPGEISLSHRGVLFLDEFPEFRRDTIEVLRQPLEDREITISRIKDTVTYPADFMLIATANPCPCGYYQTAFDCSCAPYDIIRYQRKLSGPIIDRIDMHVEVSSVNHASLLGITSKDADETNTLRTTVMRTRSMQASRFKKAEKLNSSMTAKDITSYAKLEKSAKELLDSAANKLQLSARSYIRILRIARTIADIENNPCVSTAHIAEALQYRPKSSI